MMAVDTLLSSTDLRGLLTTFWEEALQIESTPRGLVFTMPASYPDGWQVVLELSPQTPKSLRLSDRGKTLSWLTGQGQNIETDAMQDHLRRLYAEHFLHEEHGVLWRSLPLPLDPTDVQVFAEGVVAVSRLEVLNEHRVVEEDVANTTVQRILGDSGLVAKRKYRLNLARERNVAVDYFVEQRRPLAIEILKTKTDLPGTMEKWGFRWDMLKLNYPGLAPIMLYDRNEPTLDAYCHHIGETKCELFCGYDETDRIHETLDALR